MRETLLTAFAAATILSGGMLGNRAEAMTASTLTVAAAHVATVQLAVNVCGTNGCAKVQTHRIVHHKPGAVAAKHI
jgi:hypothetical protein